MNRLFNTDNMHELLAQYKIHLKKSKLYDEIYKWELLNKFTGKPELNAKDFYQEIKSIEYANLLYYNSTRVMKHLAKDKANEYKRCFTSLFDETQLLFERIKNFKQNVLDLYRQLVPEENFGTHHDERTIAVFLTYYNPEKYTFYKDNFYKKYCAFLDISPEKVGQKYIHYLKLVDNFIQDYIQKDNELLQIVKDIIPKQTFQDKNNKLLAQTILYEIFGKNVLHLNIENKKTIVLKQMDNLKKPLNKILFGPPGTGKTYKLHDEYFTQFTDANQKNYKLVTFHQNFTYEDFIEGIKPNTINGTLQYKIEKGIFYQACEEAVLLAGYKSIAHCIEDTQEGRQEAFKEALSYAIFIDEINRANVSSVFGELITLVEDDKRLGAEHEITHLTLPYSKENFAVPANLYIIATMNTADRSVEALDTALRRRFSFEEMPPRPQLLGLDVEGINLQQLLVTINKRIEKLLNKDYLIGHSFLMQVKTLAMLKSVFQNSILPLLQEYFFGDYGKIGLILGSGFVHIKKIETNIFANFEGYEEGDYAERKIYELENSLNMSDTTFKEALRKLNPACIV